MQKYMLCPAAGSVKKLFLYSIGGHSTFIALPERILSSQASTTSRFLAIT